MPNDERVEEGQLIVAIVGEDLVALDPATHEVLNLPGAAVTMQPGMVNDPAGTFPTVSRRRLLAGVAAAGTATAVTTLVLPVSSAAASTPSASSTTLAPEPESTTVPADPDFDIAMTPGDGEIVVEVIEDDA